MRDLMAAVKEQGAEVGIAFDGDADRVGAVDENGRIVYGDELMVIFSRAILKAQSGRDDHRRSEMLAADV